MRASAQSVTQSLPCNVQSLPFNVLSGCSTAARLLNLQVARFSPHFRSLLVTGESGSGKELLARAIHQASPLAAHSFHSLTIPDYVRSGLVDGFLFLHDLSHACLDLQEQLLHHLENLESNARVVIAGTCDPRGMMASGRLRIDFLDRIHALEIRVPALRERIEDLPDLLSGALDRSALSQDDLLRMQRHPWPGNLYELWTVCKAYSATGHMLLQTPVVDRPLESTLQSVIDKHVVTVLEHCAGNKFKAAEMLGISRSTLYRMLAASA